MIMSILTGEMTVVHMTQYILYADLVENYHEEDEDYDEYD